MNGRESVQHVLAAMDQAAMDPGERVGPDETSSFCPWQVTVAFSFVFAVAVAVVVDFPGVRG